jgi:hypothetical protein
VQISLYLPDQWSSNAYIRLYLSYHLDLLLTLVCVPSNGARDLSPLCSRSAQLALTHLQPPPTTSAVPLHPALAARYLHRTPYTARAEVILVTMLSKVSTFDGKPSSVTAYIPLYRINRLDSISEAQALIAMLRLRF